MSDDLQPNHPPTSASVELVLYQLGEIKREVREGFTRMEGRFDKAELRIAALERFRERVEERERAIARNEGSQTGKTIAAMTTIVTVLGGIMYAIVTQAH